MSGRSRLYILNSWICRRIGKPVLVDSAMIWWYGLSPEESPEADLAPTHAGVPALEGSVVDAGVERAHPGGRLSVAGSGGRVLVPMAGGAMVTVSENPGGSGSQQQLSRGCYSRGVGQRFGLAETAALAIQLWSLCCLKQRERSGRESSSDLLHSIKKALWGYQWGYPIKFWNNSNLTPRENYLYSMISGYRQGAGDHGL